MTTTGGIDTDDIRAAVAAGILSERQAASLTALAHSRQGARENLAAGDEPFEMFHGFNEVFIMVGLCILGAGWSGLMGIYVSTELTSWRSALGAVFAATVALIWLLSEYFIRRRRMIGPAILLSCFFAMTVAFGFAQWSAQVFMLAQQKYSSLVLPGVLTIGALILYWLRFKVPFVMALIALAMFGTAILIAATSAGTPESLNELFLLSGQSGFGWLTLGLGLATFALAMVFDGSDPHRVTRRAAQGFWLHMVASPMLINTVALSLLTRSTEGANALLFASMGLFAVIAVVIDRRSFLLAAIFYVVSVLFTLPGLTEDGAVAALVLGLGLFMVLLGAFWIRIRGFLLRILPLGGLRHYLPPAR